MSIAFAPFEGNCPKNVSKDAKYAVRTGSRGPVVTLTYHSSNRERWLATTEDHPDLVKMKMVNTVKLNMGDAPNGPFYINEYSQVIVPVGANATYYVADDYDLALVFEFEGRTLSGEANDEEGEPLDPGDLWTGPHPGIPYVLKAGELDIYYAASPRPNVERKMFLSDHVGKNGARVVAERVQTVKGWNGGRFYINEWREMFAPVNGADGLRYVYIGYLDGNDPWFPKRSGAE